MPARAVIAPSSAIDPPDARCGTTAWTVLMCRQNFGVVGTAAIAAAPSCAEIGQFVLPHAALTRRRLLARVALARLARVSLARVGLVRVALARVALARVALARVALARVGLAGLAWVALALAWLTWVALARLARARLARVRLARVRLVRVRVASVGLTSVGLACVRLLCPGLCRVWAATTRPEEPDHHEERQDEGVVEDYVMAALEYEFQVEGITEERGAQHAVEGSHPVGLATLHDRQDDHDEAAYRQNWNVCAQQSLLQVLGSLLAVSAGILGAGDANAGQ